MKGMPLRLAPPQNSENATHLYHRPGVTVCWAIRCRILESLTVNPARCSAYMAQALPPLVSGFAEVDRCKALCGLPRLKEERLAFPCHLPL